MTMFYVQKCINDIYLPHYLNIPTI